MAGRCWVPVMGVGSCDRLCTVHACMPTCLVASACECLPQRVPALGARRPIPYGVEGPAFLLALLARGTLSQDGQQPGGKDREGGR